MLTKSEVIAMLSIPANVEIAVTALQAQQTADEASAGITRYQNGRGWNAREAAFGKSLALWIKSGRHLTSAQLAAATKMCKGHAGQLAEIGTFENRTSILGIEDRFYKPIHDEDVTYEFTPLGPKGMTALVMDFDPFCHNC